MNEADESHEETTVPDDRPTVVVVMSGKRKTGKDYVARILHEMLLANGMACATIHLSGPLKRTYAIAHGLDYDELLSDSAYKESFRADMIAWGEAQRERDSGFFCRAAVTEALPNADVWIVSDARRPTDLTYFREHYDQVIMLRVDAPEHVRSLRGWTFTPGVDNAASECALDSYDGWDVVIDNSSDGGALRLQLSSLMERIQLRVAAAAL